MLLAELAATSGSVAAESGRLAKIDLLAGLLSRLPENEIETGVAYLAGDLPQGRIGVGYATVAGLSASAAASPELELAEVDATLDDVAALTGSGSQRARAKALEALLARATAPEQDFLRRLLLGELRQGALEGLMVDAIARAAEVPAEVVRRSLMLSGHLGSTARTALVEGRPGLERVRLRLMQPVQPMLAQTADDPATALARLGEAVCEWKLDGARVQVHRRGGEVRAYSRSLKEVTARLPELVAAVLDLDVETLILDGETLALSPEQRPRPFQETMGSFGRQTESDTVLTPFFFDCLHLDGDELLDRPTIERVMALESVVPAAMRIPRIVTADPAEAEAFWRRALERGHEGIMMKSPTARYEAGRRGASWLKVKPVHTLDLVVLAAEWGSGRRRGKLSNLHLGARDPDGGGFVMLGKTFKGLTDEMLAWQTERFLELETRRRGHVVYVRPEQVVEIAFDGVQRSTRYAGGMALRFARVKRYRDDKTAADADTVDTVRAFLLG